MHPAGTHSGKQRLTLQERLDNPITLAHRGRRGPVTSSKPVCCLKVRDFNTGNQVLHNLPIFHNDATWRQQFNTPGIL